MAAYADEKSPIWQWVVHGFAGERTGWRIEWHRSGPYYPGYSADSRPPNKGSPAFIEIAPANAGIKNHYGVRTAEEMWSSLVFELNNIARGREFTMIYEEALAGRLSRNKFIEENTRVEFEALQDETSTYEHLWKPWADAKGFPAKSPQWTRGKGRYETWIAQYTDHHAYPWDSWGQYFDKLRAYRLKLGLATP